MDKSFSGRQEEERAQLRRPNMWKGPERSKAQRSPRRWDPPQEAMRNMADKELEGPLSHAKESCETGDGLIQFLIKEMTSRAIKNETGVGKRLKVRN